MVLVGRKLLPNRNPAGETGGDGLDLSQLYSLGEEVSFVQLAPDSKLDGTRLAESRLGSALGLNVIGIFRGKRSILAPGPDTELQAGDRLLVERPARNSSRSCVASSTSTSKTRTWRSSG